MMAAAHRGGHRGAGGAAGRIEPRFRRHHRCRRAGGLDAVGTAEIDAAAYARRRKRSQAADNAKLMTALRTAEAIAAQAVAPEHQHALADITDAGALAGAGHDPADGDRPFRLRHPGRRGRGDRRHPDHDGRAHGRGDRGAGGGVGSPAHARRCDRRGRPGWPERVGAAEIEANAVTSGKTASGRGNRRGTGQWGSHRGQDLSRCCWA